jgi:16S rRNA C1402 (ribose-2'-O) methylase RsmI
LTKLHEEVVRGKLSEVLESLGNRELKGEAVVVVGGHERS